MNNSNFRRSLLAASLAAALVSPVAAEDIDLFTGSNSKAKNPNIVIMIDNSANWDANNQHWPNNMKQGQSELRALAKVTSEVKDGSIDLGLMLFTPGVGSSPDGGYVRFAVRTMDATNKLLFQQLVGIDGSTMTPYTCASGGTAPVTNSFGSPNCIFQNFSSPNEKVGTAKTNYSGGLFDVFKYFGGFTDPAHAINDSGSAGGTFAGSTPIDPTHFGTPRYARNGAANEPNRDAAAYTGSSDYNYVPPQGASDSCAKNYLIFIGNGFPTQDAPSSLLTGVNGDATQLKMPNFATTTSTVSAVLQTDTACHTQSQCLTLASNTYGTSYDSYTCTGGNASPSVNLGTDAVCETAAQCQTTALATYAGQYDTIICSGGTATTVSGTSPATACESRATCAANGPNYITPNTGLSNYTCTAGSQSSTTSVSLGTDPNTETIASCQATAAAKSPGWTTYSCTGGTASGTDAGTNLGTDSACYASAAACQTAATTKFPGYDSYSCGGSPAKGTCSGGSKQGYTVTGFKNKYIGMTMKATGCGGSNFYSQTVTASKGCTTGMTITGTNSCVTNMTITGTKAVTSVTATGTFSQPSSQTLSNADEWAKFMYLTDVNAAAGQQNIQTYTIDVYKDAQDANESALLFSMAKYGGGRYFRATDENSIIAALREILTEIQSVNTVFAAASLPINATNRSQNENQVFIGMFRPDGKGKPRWYGNLKHYQAALFNGDARLADSLGKEAISATTGFIQACAQSFYTTDSTTTDASGVKQYYWAFSPQSAGTCSSIANSAFNDLPDGNVVEKGGAGEVLRKGNTGTAANNFVVNRKMYTCVSAPCSSLSDFNDTNVTMARTGAADAATNTNIILYTKGQDVLDENNNTTITETRPSMHGDIAHSRPLPVNFGGSRGVEVYYGSNDGAFHALKGSNGTEIWSFIAPEHHSKLKRLYDNDPVISYPNLPTGTISSPKDYFFDGSAGLYQNADNSKVWIFPTQRRGGRMIYAFDISSAGTPTFKWVFGCASADDSNCTSNASGIGNTWSVPNAAFIKGWSSGTSPVVIVGGGMDPCEDADNATTTCTSSSKGHKVYVLNADTGAVLQALDTDGSVPADISLIDRDFDGKVDHGYVVDTRGNVYRIDFVDPATLAPLAAGAWKITKIARTTGASRKFLFGPSVLTAGNIAYLAMGSGDRERPLITNYPYTTPVQNRFYMFMDKFAAATGLPVDLDGSTMENYSSNTSCATTLGNDKNGWYMDLPGKGEQTVTSAVIFGGTVFFSTNRPIPTDPNSCDTNLGEARGYAVNLLNASGVIGTGGLCGGDRSGKFTGGGLPPSPVVGTVPVVQPDGSTKPISVLIGGINLDTGTGSPIGLQQPPIPIKSIRSRLYWYQKQ